MSYEHTHCLGCHNHESILSLVIFSATTSRRKFLGLVVVFPLRATTFNHASCGTSYSHGEPHETSYSRLLRSQKPLISSPSSFPSFHPHPPCPPALPPVALASTTGVVGAPDPTSAIALSTIATSSFISGSPAIGLARRPRICIKRATSAAFKVSYFSVVPDMGSYVLKVSVARIGSVGEVVAGE